MNTSLFEELNQKTIYRVKRQTTPVSGIVEVPGSKSITNRALFLAALAKGRSTLNGVLFSDDSRHFIQSLIDLGFEVTVDEAKKEVSVVGLDGDLPSKTGTINVGSAGTAARFLTAMLAFSDGKYTIQCSEQMKNRPMKPLFDALISLGASFQYLEKEHYLPVIVTGNSGQCGSVSLDITKSTQFLSALLMIGPMTKDGLSIQITSDKIDGSYIRITRKMLNQFGAEATLSGNTYRVPHAHFTGHTYTIEPDISAACYFYSLAPLLGGSIIVRNVHRDFMQGDIRFLEVLEQLNCKVIETTSGIEVVGPESGNYPGIDVDMNDFSDQTMTLACLAPFATSQTIIRNVSHIKGQECDRMEGIVQELSRCGVTCSADGENIHILPGVVKPAMIETYDDHRFAMAFTLLGLRSEGIVIKDPACCRKTFEDYFEVLEGVIKD